MASAACWWVRPAFSRSAWSWRPRIMRSTVGLACSSSGTLSPPGVSGPLSPASHALASYRKAILPVRRDALARGWDEPVLLLLAERMMVAVTGRDLLTTAGTHERRER